MKAPHEWSLGAPYHALQPKALLLDGEVPTSHEFVSDPSQFGHHPLPQRVTDEETVSRPRLATDVGDTQEVEGLRFAHALLGSAFSGVPTELQEPCLLRVELERKLPQPHIEFHPEASGVALILESDHEVSRPGGSHLNIYVKSKAAV